jgi:hypothetical protein
MIADTLPYAAAVLKLLQGVIYSDDPHWAMLLNYQTALYDHFSRIGLTLEVAETDGFALLRQPDSDPDQPNVPALPRLVRRIALSYPVTLLGVMLRERLDYLENKSPDAIPVVNSNELYDLLAPFVPEHGDQRALHKKMDGWIGKVVEIGFLKAIAKDSYEIRRIIKAKFDSEQLTEIKAMLMSAVDGENDDDGE